MRQNEHADVRDRAEIYELLQSVSNVSLVKHKADQPLCEIYEYVHERANREL